jgi:hypothetical protein
LDLSLARENAGGGLRGKSAKLGKLVIEDEGIKTITRTAVRVGLRTWVELALACEALRTHRGSAEEG